MARIDAFDVVDGSNYVEDGDGPRVVRIFQIVDVTGPRESRHAIAASVPGVPQINEFHPSIFGLQCVSKKVDAQGAETYKVACEYKRIDQDGGEGDPSPETQITVGSTVQEQQVNVNNAGAALKVKYTKKLEDDGKTEIPEDKQIEEEQRITISKSVPMTFARFQRREDQSPLAKSQDFVGSINSSSFLGSPNLSFLCTRIEGVSNDGGETYNVSYEFQRKKEGWVAEIYYRNGEGKVPVDVKQGVADANGYNSEFIYDEKDFNSLELP